MNTLTWASDPSIDAGPRGPKGGKHGKRPADVIGNAVHIVRRQRELARQTAQNGITFFSRVALPWIFPNGALRNWATLVNARWDSR
jgi:hypothetical protein